MFNKLNELLEWELRFIKDWKNSIKRLIENELDNILINFEPKVSSKIALTKGKKALLLFK